MGVAEEGELGFCRNIIATYRIDIGGTCGISIVAVGEAWAEGGYDGERLRSTDSYDTEGSAWCGSKGANGV